MWRGSKVLGAAKQVESTDPKLRGDNALAASFWQRNFITCVVVGGGWAGGWVVGGVALKFNHCDFNGVSEKNEVWSFGILETTYLSPIPRNFSVGRRRDTLSLHLSFYETYLVYLSRYRQSFLFTPDNYR